ncbi:MAG TPA: 50S ribosomal protein L2 [Planctomycetota bacterium]|nr:50S ribosomal protein L2 [Planctomycetota bacterium]
MALRFYRPITAGTRGASVIDFRQELTKKKPEKSLLERIPRTGGRNAHGRITNPHMQSTYAKLYRKIDYKRNKDGVPATVAGIEYDPIRSAFIALLHYQDGEKRYIIAPLGLKVGQKVISGERVEPDLGNAMPLKSMPLSTQIHCIELQPGAGGKLVRAAGGEARLLAKEGDNATIVLPSGEMRFVPAECRATVGQIGNLDHQNVTVGKAGRNRHMFGRRPRGRGMAKNPVDHPMGGGAARRKGHIPQSPSGVLAKGGKTRKLKARTNNQIIRRRTNAPSATV